eukprot:3747058-Karenia_brevis.AAC.1
MATCRHQEYETRIRAQVLVWKCVMLRNMRPIPQLNNFTKPYPNDYMLHRVSCKRNLVTAAWDA